MEKSIWPSLPFFFGGLGNMGLQLDLMIFKIFSKLNDSVKWEML